jgi:WhiB family transcriptional regulator, redox-sensing transcriptional regulator
MNPMHDRHSPSEFSSLSDWVGQLPAWRAKAACLDHDPELFFVTGSTGRAVEQAAQAKMVCAGCTVCVQCLEYALETGQEGVWGGTTEDERRSLRRARQHRARG